MNIRRSFWGSLVLIAVLVAASGAVLGGWFDRPNPSSPSGLVLLGQGSQMRLLANGSSTEQLLASDVTRRQWGFPAVSPSGDSIAYIAEKGVEYTIYRLRMSDLSRIELYRSQINRPFALAWSPNGEYLSFLLSSSSGLSVHLVRSDGHALARLIASTISPQPEAYMTWSEDSRTLLMHLDGHALTGGRLSSYTLNGRNEAHTIAIDPAFFQTPAWSFDGKYIYYAAQPAITSNAPSIDDLESHLVRVTAEGKDAMLLANEKLTHLRMMRAPESDQLAYIATPPENGALLSGPLKLVNGTGGTPRMLSRADEAITAFFWSPDGQQIAYLTSTGTEHSDGQRIWHTVDIASGAIRDWEAFTPSSSMVGLQRYFDAYLFAFSPWSPDSRQIAYGTSDGIQLIDLVSGTTTRVGDGDLALWIAGAA